MILLDGLRLRIDDDNCVIIRHCFLQDVIIGPFESRVEATAFAVNQYGFAYQSNQRAWTIRPLQAP